MFKLEKKKLKEEKKLGEFSIFIDEDVDIKKIEVKIVEAVLGNAIRSKCRVALVTVTEKKKNKVMSDDIILDEMYMV